MEIKIIATTGRAQGQSVEIKAAKFFIGRHENCQLRPDIPGLSGIHALIEQREMRLYLRDFGGEGGTGINDRVLHARETEIGNGDLIQIGPMVLTLSVKAKGEEPRGMVHAPDGWPFLEGIAYEPALETEPAPVLEAAPPKPRSEPHPKPRVPAGGAAVAVASHTIQAPPTTAPAAPLPALARPIGTKPSHHRALCCRMIDNVLVATVVSPDLNEEETVSPVRYELRSILDEADTPSRMVIDLGNTRFLSSRAVGVILAHYQGLERKGATMRVCGVSREIKPVLDQMRLSMLIDIYPTVEEAVQTPWD
jgi:anti-anti-sigma factor